MLTVRLICRCRLTVRLSVRSGRYFGSRTVTSDAPALPPTPGRYGWLSVGVTEGSGADKPSGPMRKAVLGSTPLAHWPLLLGPVQETACNMPGARSGVST